MSRKRVDLATWQRIAEALGLERLPDSKLDFEMAFLATLKASKKFFDDACLFQGVLMESRREHLHTQEQLNKLKQEYEILKCQKKSAST